MVLRISRDKIIFILVIVSLAMTFFLLFSPLGRNVFFRGLANKKNALDYFDRGIAAYNKQKHKTFRKSLHKAVKLAPNNPNFLYALARAYALQGMKKEALKYLDKVVAMGFYFNSRNGGLYEKEKGDFDSIRDTAEFGAILKKIEKLNAPINNSRLALIIPEKDLMPESVAYDPVEQAFYVGSLYKRKIIKIGASGNMEDFKREKENGLWSVTGIKLDVKRRFLWVNSCSHSKMRDGDNNLFGLAGVFKFRLSDGELINKFILDERPILHLFNDLAISPQGDIFITDSLFGAIYVISEEKNKLELFFRKKEQFSKPNGIALSDDEKYLYVSHAEGISVINTGTGSSSNLAHPENLSVTQIDGLYFFKGSLIAIQGNYRPSRVVRLFLDKSLKRIEKSKIIESDHPLFMLPTTGVIAGDLFYYIANSQLPLYNQGDIILPLDKLDDIAILVTRLE